MAVADMTDRELLNKIKQHITGQPDKVPPGFKRVGEWQKSWGVSSSQAGRLISVAVKNGMMKEEKFRIRTTHAVKPVIHYAKA